jgi:hypothetical protein
MDSTLCLSSSSDFDGFLVLQGQDLSFGEPAEFSGVFSVYWNSGFWFERTRQFGNTHAHLINHFLNDAGFGYLRFKPISPEFHLIQDSSDQKIGYSQV